MTPTEATVVELLRRCRVATKQEICQRLEVSHMTVVRALVRYGYYTSLNHNSAFYTLHDTPTFDDDGLWFFRQIGFSRHGTLAQTLTALVEQSPAGWTVPELEQRLRTKVANLMSRLCAAQRLGRSWMGRRVVYLAREPQPQARQLAARQQLLQPPPAPRRPAVPVPPEWDAASVIQLLAQIVRTPEASDASLSQTLQARGLSITAAGVRVVKQFYGLQEKKTTP